MVRQQQKFVKRLNEPKQFVQVNIKERLEQLAEIVKPSAICTKTTFENYVYKE